MESRLALIDDQLITRREAARRMGYRSPRSIFRLEKLKKIKRAPSCCGQARYRLSDILALVTEGGAI